jgi:midasin (ATPase involved in ribosome maturation)
MKLQKLYGSPTIENGTMKFNESILVKATQSPSVILFDEINAVENKSTFDWHALLENRELYIKDKGQAYKLHPKCRIGFAQNPRSAKYIGGNVLASNFLGRCVFLTYPEFNKRELKKALSKAFPSLSQEETEQFIVYYQSLLDVIDRASLPIDISIRQLMHTVKLYKAGIGLKQSLELGIINMLDSVSQPTVKESLHKLAIGIWQELLNKEKQQQNPATVEWLVWNTIWRHTNE